MQINAKFLKICSHEKTNSFTSWMAWEWLHLNFLGEQFLWMKIQAYYYIFIQVLHNRNWPFIGKGRNKKGKPKHNTTIHYALCFIMCIIMCIIIVKSGSVPGPESQMLFCALTADGNIVQFWMIQLLQVLLHSMNNHLNVWNVVLSKNKLKIRALNSRWKSHITHSLRLQKDHSLLLKPLRFIPDPNPSWEPNDWKIPKGMWIPCSLFTEV